MSSSPVTSAGQPAAVLAELRVMILRLRDDTQIIRRDLEVQRRRTDMVYELLNGRHQPAIAARPFSMAPLSAAAPSPAVPSPAYSVAPLLQSFNVGRPPDLNPSASPPSFAAWSPPGRPDTAPPDPSPNAAPPANPNAGQPLFTGWPPPWQQEVAPAHTRIPTTGAPFGHHPPEFTAPGLPNAATAATTIPWESTAAWATSEPALSTWPPPGAASTSFPPLSNSFHTGYEPPPNPIPRPPSFARWSSPSPQAAAPSQSGAYPPASKHNIWPRRSCRTRPPPI